MYEDGAKEIALSVVSGINCKYNIVIWLFFFFFSHCPPQFLMAFENIFAIFIFIASIFAYGQTSSGKTYTMTGITECTVADIFDYIHRVMSFLVFLIFVFSVTLLQINVLLR